MADNEKAYHEIAANTTCEFVNKELLQELDKTTNASILEDEDKVVYNLKSYLASFKRNNLHKKILLNVQGWVLEVQPCLFQVLIVMVSSVMVSNRSIYLYVTIYS
jgi:hypothetical protein